MERYSLNLNLSVTTYLFKEIHSFSQRNMGLNDHRIFQSMSRKGTYLDSFPMKNFFSILK